MTIANRSAALVFVVAWACGVPDPGDELSEDAGSAEQDRLVLSDAARIQYIGAFSWDGAVRTDSGYEFTNDLGYGFRVDRFRIATYSAQLRRCDTTEATARRSAASAARPDHVVDDDMSISITDYSEDALASTWHELGVGDASSTSYCQKFLLSTMLTSSDPVLDGDSIAVAGSYRAPGESSWIAFDARIPLGEGALLTLRAGTPAVAAFESQDGSTPAVRVVVTRYPVAAFANIRPDTVSSAQLAWELLGGVLHTGDVYFQRQADSRVGPE